MIQSFGWEGCEALSAVGILFKLLHVVVVALGVIIGVVVVVSVVAVVVVCGWYGCCCWGTFKSWLWLLGSWLPQDACYHMQLYDQQASKMHSA